MASIMRHFANNMAPGDVFMQTQSIYHGRITWDDQNYGQLGLKLPGFIVIVDLSQNAKFSVPRARQLSILHGRQTHTTASASSNNSTSASSPDGAIPNQAELNSNTRLFRFGLNHFYCYVATSNKVADDLRGRWHNGNPGGA